MFMKIYTEYHPNDVIVLPEGGTKFGTHFEKRLTDSGRNELDTMLVFKKANLVQTMLHDDFLGITEIWSYRNSVDGKIDGIVGIVHGQRHFNCRLSFQCPGRHPEIQGL